MRTRYAFSKDWAVPEAVTSFGVYASNFRWAVRTLGQGNRVDGDSSRTPALAAGLTDHVWSLQEWLTFPMSPGQRTT